jgi:hypothetical protein
MTVKLVRLPFLMMALLSLLAGAATGLARIGWTELSTPSMVHHGGIMIGGFIGTLIILEKIIPLKRRWLFVLPFFSAGSVALFFAGLTGSAFILLILAGIGLTAVFLHYLMMEKSIIYLLMLTGSLCWTTGNILLLKTGAYPPALPWWMAFALFVISAERIELMKFLPVTKKQKYLFIMILVVFITGSKMSFHQLGNIISGFSLIFVTLWLMRFDIIAISLRKDGVTRYVASALLSGYFSLLVSGIVLLFFARHLFGYDTLVHTFFIGFVFAMIFAHGPIILPGVMGITVKPYHRIFYFWLFLLHASWIIRAFSGLVLDFEGRKVSGILALTAFVGYFISLAWVTILRYRKNKSFY